MKQARLVCLLIALYFNIGAQDKVNISVNTDKESAVIFINSRYAGSGSLDTILVPGKYEIKVRSDSRRWGVQTYIDTVEISSNVENISLDYDFYKEIVIDSEPQDAYLFNRDSLVGNTPVILYGLEDTLTLRKPEYESKLIMPGENNNSKIRLDFTGSRREFSFTESPWFKVLIGSAVALGATAAYFKLKADSRFEEYENTGDPSLLDQTEKYDLYSGISFAALQINFGILIYFFLSE